MGKTYTNPKYQQARKAKQAEKQAERNAMVLGMILSGKANTRIMGDRRDKRSNDYKNSWEREREWE